MSLNKRKRRPTGDSLPEVKEDSKPTKKKTRTTSSCSIESEITCDDKLDESNEVEKENKKSSVNVKNNKKEEDEEKVNRKADKKKHKKHKHTETSPHHRHRHKAKHRHRGREGDRPLPHVEPGVNELTFRIKSPPPPLTESWRPCYREKSESELDSSSQHSSEDETEDNDSEYTPQKEVVSALPVCSYPLHHLSVAGFFWHSLCFPSLLTCSITEFNYAEYFPTFLPFLVSICKQCILNYPFLSL